MKKILLILLLLFLLFCGVVIFNQENIVHPKRRALQPYHLEWLEHPKEHSMKIVKDKHVFYKKSIEFLLKQNFKKN
jgi:hypothetical protein